MKHAFLGLSLLLVALGGGAPVYAQSDATGAPPRDPGWVASDAPSKDNWRTRIMLDEQHRAKDKSPPMRGVEQETILDNYQKSIGKGGAGAPLLPRDDESSQTPPGR